MKLTREQIDIIIPDLEAPITEDEYLASICFDNEGLDYGAIIDYDHEEERQLVALMNQMVSA